MGVLIQIAAFAEFLAPDFLWIGLLTPMFFAVIGIAEAVGLSIPGGGIRAFELSIFLAYLASIAIGVSDASALSPPSGRATSHYCGSRLSPGKVQDATK